MCTSSVDQPRGVSASRTAPYDTHAVESPTTSRFAGAIGNGDDVGGATVTGVVTVPGSEGAVGSTIGGTVVVVGLAGGRIPFGFAAVPHEARFLTSVWGSRAQLDELLALARREPTIVQPVEILPLDQAQVAHDRLRAGDVRGRIVLVPNVQH